VAEAFVPLIRPPSPLPQDALCFAFRDGELLVRVAGGRVEVTALDALTRAGLSGHETHALGLLDGRPCLAVTLPDDAPVPDGFALEGLRALWSRLAEPVFAVAARASQIVSWDRDHRFCGRCGAPTTPARGERARVCGRCGHAAYPRLSPAVIVAVERGDEILLARGTRFPGAMYSVLAGFVEPGESLEECVVREIREEAGIEVEDVRYFASQSWPFPHSLMVGFTARHAGGSLRIDPEEILEADWFAASSLPAELPGRISIARALIDDWLARYAARSGADEDE
jgi:NAD+ diphosphatase